jgi:hypothetical protein
MTTSALAGGPVTRQGAQDEARRELSRPVYAGRHEPGWLRRAVDWIDHQLSGLFDWLIPHAHGGGANYTGLSVFAGLLVIVALVVARRLRLGPLGRSAKGRGDETDLASPLSAAALRAEAEAQARAGRYADAVRSRLRAVTRMLEEKGVLDPRPSRTAGELVTDLATVTPTGAAELDAAVAAFSDVWYGGLSAGADDYAVIVRADEALSAVRRPVAGDRPAEPASPAVPA